MARIERYNKVDSPDVEDIVIGTDKDDSNQTKNFRLGDILAMAEGVDLNFTSLEDTPSTYANSAGKIPVVRFEEQGLIFKDPTEVFNVGDLTLLELDDTPGSYVGESLKVLRVKSDELGVEFYDIEVVLTEIQNEINILENQVDDNSSAIAELNAAVSQIESQISQINSELDNKVDDAPSDGDIYVRKSSNWVKLDLSNYVTTSELPSTDSLTQSINGTFNIDWDAYSNWDLTITGNTTISQTNTPIAGKEKTITIYVVGDFALELPPEWVVKNAGVYDGVNGSQIVVQSWNNGTYYTVIN